MAESDFDTTWNPLRQCQEMLDTAEMYAGGGAEELVGEGIAGRPQSAHD